MKRPSLEFELWLFENRERFGYRSRTDEFNFQEKNYYWSNWSSDSGPLAPSGHGVHTDKKNSLMIAAAECVERQICFGNGLRNTNGMAIHFDPQMAKEKAVMELVERDAYLGHWYGNLSPYPRKTLITELGQVQVFELASAQEAVHVVMAVAPLREGHILGLGTARDYQAAETKALLEMAGIWSGINIIYPAPLGLAEFKALELVRPIDHARWALSQEASRHFKSWLEGRPQLALEVVQNRLRRPLPEVQEMPWPYETKGPNLSCMRASSKEYLGLFFGTPKREFLESKGLEKWMECSASDFNSIPHTFS